jgi:hypothetical protein
MCTVDSTSNPYKYPNETNSQHNNEYRETKNILLIGEVQFKKLYAIILLTRYLKTIGWGSYSCFA